MAYNKKAVLASCLALGILVLALAKDIYAQACYQDPEKYIAVIYEDSLLSGWTTTGSWGITLPVVQNSTPTYRWGSYALQVQYTSTNGELEFYRYGMNTAGHEYVSFRIRKEDANGMIFVKAHKLDGTVSNSVSLSTYLVPLTSSSFVAGKWYSVRVPFSAMNISSGTILQGIIFQSSTLTTAYFDDVVLIPGLSLGFPLAGNPWSKDISSAFDHTMTKTYIDDANNVVTAWTGEIGDGASHSSDPTCRQKSASDIFFGSTFYLNGHYNAPSDCGSNNFYLSYNGHPGIDYPVSNGTSVFAAEAGTIIQLDCPANGSSCVGQGSGEGRIRIQHSNGFTTWYMHLSSRVSTLTLGGSVYKGQPIGASGQTSAKNIGPHLHFQVTTGPGINSTPIDPYGWEGWYRDPYRINHETTFNCRQWE